MTEHADATIAPLTDSIMGAASAIAVLAKVGRTNRIIVRWLTVSLVLDVALSVLCLLGLNVLHTSDTRLNALSSNAHQRCVAGNVYREDDKKRWLGILAFSGPPTTASGRATEARFVALIDTTDALVLCPTAN